MRNIAHHGHYNSVKLSSHQECIRQKSNAFSTYPDQRKQTVFLFFKKKATWGQEREKIANCLFWLYFKNVEPSRPFHHVSKFR